MADEMGGISKQRGADEAQLSQDAVSDLDDEDKLSEELMEMFEDLVDDKEDEKVNKKKDVKDVLQEASQLKVWIMNQMQQNAAAMGAAAEVVGAASSPNIPPPNAALIGGLRGVLTGKGGRGNEWLSRSLAVEMFSVMWDLIPILARIKIAETKLANMMLEMQWKMTTTQAEAQMQKAELQAVDLELQALKSFIQAGLTAGMMVIQAAKQLSDKVSGNAKAGLQTAKNRGQLWGKKAIGKGYEEAKGVKQEGTGAARGIKDLGKTAEETPTTATAAAPGTPGAAATGAPGAATTGAGATGTGGTGTSTPGTAPGGGTATDAAKEAKEKGGTLSEFKSKVGDKVGDKMKDWADTDTSKYEKGKYDSREQAHITQQRFQSFDAILQNVASGIVDLARAHNQRLIGIQEFNITILQQLRENIGKAMESAKEQRREASDLIAAVLQMATKYLDLQSQAFRMSR